LTNIFITLDHETKTMYLILNQMYLIIKSFFN